MQCALIHYTRKWAPYRVKWPLSSCAPKYVPCCHSTSSSVVCFDRVLTNRETHKQTHILKHTNKSTYVHIFHNTRAHALLWKSYARVERTSTGACMDSIVFLLCCCVRAVHEIQSLVHELLHRRLEQLFGADIFVRAWRASTLHNEDICLAVAKRRVFFVVCDVCRVHTRRKCAQIVGQLTKIRKCTSRASVRAFLFRKHITLSSGMGESGWIWVRRLGTLNCA